VDLDAKETKTVAIRLEKPSASPGKKPREKQCATCGKLFALGPGQKFFDCPICYQQKITLQRSKKTRGAKVLTQIQCASCGAVEFVRFVPDDPKSVLCRPCFVKQGQEQKGQKTHHSVVKT
jgi:CxxC-x17-CxxC domain-containing protein